MALWGNFVVILYALSALPDELSVNCTFFTELYHCPVQRHINSYDLFIVYFYYLLL